MVKGTSANTYNVAITVELVSDEEISVYGDRGIFGTEKQKKLLYTIMRKKESYRINRKSA